MFSSVTKLPAISPPSMLIQSREFKVDGRFEKIPWEILVTCLRTLSVKGHISAMTFRPSTHKRTYSFRSSSSPTKVEAVQRMRWTIEARAMAQAKKWVCLTRDVGKVISLVISIADRTILGRRILCDCPPGAAWGCVTHELISWDAKSWN